MSLGVGLSSRDDDHRGVSFEALGGVIGTVGTPHFVQRLSALLHDVVPLDVAHVERTRVDGTAPAGYRSEWFGSAGDGFPASDVADVMSLYYDSFQASDPLFSSLRGALGTQIVLRDVDALPPDEFRERIFDVADITHECVLAKGTHHAQYSIALVRGRRLPPFSLAELARLRNVGDLLFPLLELHASMAAAKRVAHPGADAAPLAAFDARIDASRIRLSNREYETCKHLLAGKTVPETAGILGVRLTSAESYVKRAFGKLGVRTKRELLAWACAVAQPW
ncbi:helix-turn-helix transcriptional regulator [Burkholderia guangdongensis]|uniref:helix-turn-helix transcriptional regulator n=1 Tax=Burkholderia guangdongensis TaxID=1792500 RepID=UPI0015CECA0C|nr:helix-turn-helix transcriptional regulator [Burkholderia guangdongensis]